MNYRGVWAIFNFEMARFFRTFFESLASPVISTALYFVVFGAAIGSRMENIDGVSYGAFIVPGLIMLSVMTLSIANASFGIYFPKFIGTIYEVFSAPLSFYEIVLGYVGAASVKSMIIGLVIFITSLFFVEIHVAHPFMMIVFLLLTSVSFSLFGFILGIWAKSWQQLQVVPTLVITPLVFLGGSFYSIDMLPEIWQKISLINPVVYLVSGFRWAFFNQGDVGVMWSLFAISFFLLLCLFIIGWMFKTGYRLRQ